MAIEKSKNESLYSKTRRTAMAVATSSEKRKIPVYLSREEINIMMNGLLEEIKYNDRLRNEGRISNEKYMGKKKRIWRDYVIIETLFNTGVRNTELRTIRFVDIDRFIGKSIKVKTLKKRGKEKNAERLLPVSDRLINDLFTYRDLWKVKDGNNIVYNDNDVVFPITQDMVNKIVNKCGRAVGIQRRMYGALTLRHSFAVNCVREGLNIEALRQLMGHSSVTVTQIYFRIVQGEDSGLVRNIKFFE